MAKLVTGLFRARSSAMLAIEDLMRHAVPQEDISVLMTDTATGREFYTEMASKAPEYGVAGTIIGGIIGGLLSSLIALGYVRDIGFGLATMSIYMAALVGIGAGMVIGLILGLIAGAAVPEYESTFAPVNDKKSGYLVGVYCHPRRELEVRRLLEAAGGTRIHTKGVPDTAVHVYGTREYVTSTPTTTSLPPEDRIVE